MIRLLNFISAILLGGVAWAKGGEDGEYGEYFGWLWLLIFLLVAVVLLQPFFIGG